jgi:hypothetical protein
MVGISTTLLKMKITETAARTITSSCIQTSFLPEE